MAIAVGATRQILADAYTGSGSWFSIHTATPGSTGASEASGGSYARKQTTWGTGSAGVTAGSQMTFDLNSGTYTHTGMWTAVTAGTFRDGCAMTSTVLSVAGQILVTPTITIT
jgi:hypothetical protein